MTTVVCLWSAGAHAQINPFRSYGGPVLSKADLEQGTKAADKLLRTDEAKVGTSQAWAGPDGNHGTLTIRSAFERKGNTCRSLRSVVDYKKTGAKREWTLNVCRIPSGDWKLI